MSFSMQRAGHEVFVLRKINEKPNIISSNVCKASLFVYRSKLRCPMFLMYLPFPQFLTLFLHIYFFYYFLSSRTLLELGASPNYRDAKGLTSVYLSVAKKTDPKISEALLHDHAVLGTQDTQGWHEVHQVRRLFFDTFVLVLGLLWVAFC